MRKHHINTRHPPGDKCQIDWGQVGIWHSHRLYCFVAALAWSRTRYVEFGQRQDVETPLTCLVRAWHYFGGVPVGDWHRKIRNLKGFRK